MPEPSLHIARTVTALRLHVETRRSSGGRVAVVPTMGALHDGHLSLVRAAKASADRVCATLFVNPTQFAANEDLGTYPRDEAADCAMLAAEGVDLLYAPGSEEMYPPGEITRITMPGMGDCLEGEHRPGFFTGVATVVAKLLIQTTPHVALFGEKDFQQLQVIRRMVTDLSLPVEIVGFPTVRDPDGLALSSRNAYLTDAERAAAPRLYQALCNVRDHLMGGGSAQDIIDQETAALVDAGFSNIDYLTVRNAATFDAVENTSVLGDESGRVLAAAILGRARLIDNIPL